jgi:transcription elongation factor Elf1
MILFGSRGYTIKLGRLEKRYCPTCTKEQDFSVSMTYNYDHFFFMPLFSSRPKYFTNCKVCGCTFELETSKLKRSVTDKPKPWIHRFGWVVVVCMVIVLILATIGYNSL